MKTLLKIAHLFVLHDSGLPCSSLLLCCAASGTLVQSAPLLQRTLSVVQSVHLLYGDIQWEGAAYVAVRSLTSILQLTSSAALLCLSIISTTSALLCLSIISTTSFAVASSDSSYQATTIGFYRPHQQQLQFQCSGCLSWSYSYRNHMGSWLNGWIRLNEGQTCVTLFEISAGSTTKSINFFQFLILRRNFHLYSVGARFYDS